MQLSSVVVRTALALSVTFAAPALASSLTAKSVKVYKGKDGVRVTVVRLAGGSGHAPEALVKVEGTDADVDGKILKVTIRGSGDREDWETYELGKGRYVLITKRDGDYDLYVPGTSDRTVALTYDEKASPDAKAEPIVSEYEAAHPSPKK